MWWSLFGVFTLVWSIAAALWARKEARWRGTGPFPTTTSQPYEELVSEHQGMLLQYYLGVRGVSGFDFLLKPERWYDRLFKLIGVSSEMRVGDARFDRAWYVVSEDWLLRRALASSPRLRNDLLMLLSECSRMDMALKRLRCQSGRLWVVLKPRQRRMKQVQGQRVSRAKAIVPILGRIAGHLSHLRPDRFTGVRDRYARRAWILVSISSALALYATVQLLRIEFSHFPLFLDPRWLQWHAILAGTAAVAVLMFTASVMLGGTSRAHMVIFEILLTGSVGAIGTAYVTLRDVNMDFDGSKRQVVEVALQSKEVSSTRRSTRYYLNVSDWRQGNAAHRFQVGRSLFDRSKAGDKLYLILRQGALGHPWVEDLVLPDIPLK